MSDLSGRVAIVTGAASGLGREIALALAGAGAAVVSADIDAEGAGTTAADIDAAGGRAATAACDITKAGDRGATVEVARRLGTPAILVNSAGIGLQKAALETSVDDMERLMAVNLVGPFHLAQLAAADMVAAGWGRIIHIASVAGLRGATGRAAYGASKAALINLTQVMAVELGGTGVTSNAIAPGPVETPIVAKVHTEATRAAWVRAIPAGRYGEPSEIAAAALYLAGGSAGYVNGHVLAVDGGFAATGLKFDL